MTAAGPVAVVGPGRVGRSLAGALTKAGRVAATAGRERELPDGWLGREGLTLVFAVPDDALEEAAGAWSDRLERAPTAGRRVALHTSGVHPPEALGPLRERGFALGGWHPLVALASAGEGAFRGAACGLFGEEAAVRRGRALARLVGARPLELGAAGLARYHAAAVFASNHLVACLAAAADELEHATDGEGRLEDLLPLARSALENVAERGLVGGLTGPVQRGDVGTVRRHLEALGPERAELYRGLARELLALDVAGRDRDRLRELRRVLEADSEKGPS